jgi:hypothetical protein
MYSERTLGNWTTLWACRVKLFTTFTYFLQLYITVFVNMSLLDLSQILLKNIRLGWK